MPLYDYACACGNKEEMFLMFAQLDEPQFCPKCQKEMGRVISLPPAYHGEVFQMCAILSDGRKVPGHFGKTAPIRKVDRRVAYDKKSKSIVRER